MKKFFTILNLIRPIVDMQKLGDHLLDALENYVERTDNETDDKLVLPVITGLRLALRIPDEDDNTENN
jgi:hypothetical protein